MSGSAIYQIKRSTKFETSYSSLVKTHYRKNRQGIKDFEGNFKKYLKTLREDPYRDSDREPFPANTYHSGFELRKKRWKRLPGLDGTARLGRLIFMIHESSKTVYLLWIYTHAEFEKRPPASELSGEVKYAQQETVQA